MRLGIRHRISNGECLLKFFLGFVLRAVVVEVTDSRLEL